MHDDGRRRGSRGWATIVALSGWWYTSTVPHTSPIARWILENAHLVAGVPELMAGVAACMDDAGLALLRTTVQLPVLHPEVSVRMWVWRRTHADFELREARVIVRSEDARESHGVVQTVDLAHDAWSTPAFAASPIRRLLVDGDPQVHCTIAPSPSALPFPILEDLRRDGATGYLALALRTSSGRGACSFATTKPGGFEPAEVALLEDMLPVFALALERHAARRVAEVLLQTYVGPHAGERVLQGRIRRGDVDTLRAAIWFSDLRGFTALCAAHPSSAVVGWLNAYFELVASAVHGQQGEILKFIGDAVLAVFPVTDAGEADACDRALRAARSVDAAMDELNTLRAENGEPALTHGIGLHLGEALYGNIGGRTRLDFTVIGPDVNLASRLEGLCATLGRRTIVSQRLRDRSPEGLEWLGVHTLKGVPEPVEVYGA
jgi:adenylate cyclase